MEKMKNRIPLWDNVKFLMILLMVIGHFALFLYNKSYTCKTIYVFIYAFHMPVLFFVAGLFYSPERAKQRILYYFFSGLILKLALFLCRCLLGKEPTFALLSEGDLPWFMFALVHFNLLMIPLRHVNKWFVIGVSVLLACFVGYDTSVGDFLVLSRTIVFFPFFFSGTLFVKETLEQKIIAVKKRYWIVCPLAIALLLAWGYICFHRQSDVLKYLHLFKGKYAFTAKVIRFGPLARLGCYIVTALTGAAVILLCPHREVKGVTKMGSNTIHVYFWHMIIYVLLAEIIPFEQIFLSGTFGRLAYFAIGALLCITICSIRLFKWPLDSIKPLIQIDPVLPRDPKVSVEEQDKKDEEK